MSSEAGPKGEGQDARSKREVSSNCLERLLLCHRCAVVRAGESRAKNPAFSGTFQSRECLSSAAETDILKRLLHSLPALAFCRPKYRLGYDDMVTVEYRRRRAVQLIAKIQRLRDATAKCSVVSACKQAISRKVVGR